MKGKTSSAPYVKEEDHQGTHAVGPPSPVLKAGGRNAVCTSITVVRRQPSYEAGGTTITQEEEDGSRASFDRCDADAIRRRVQELHVRLQQLRVDLEQPDHDEQGIQEIETQLASLRLSIESKEALIEEMRAQQERRDILEASREIRDLVIDGGKGSLQQEPNKEGDARMLNEELLEMHSELSHRRQQSRQTELAVRNEDEVRHSGQLYGAKNLQAMKEQLYRGEDPKFHFQIQRLGSEGGDPPAQNAKRDATSHHDASVTHMASHLMVPEGSIRTLKGTNQGSTCSNQPGHAAVKNVQKTMQSRYRQYMEIVGSHDSSDFKMMMARAQRAHPNVAVFGQSFKINMKNISKGNKDIRIKQVASGKREARSPGTAMMAQREHPSTLNAVGAGKSPEENLQADTRQRTAEQAAMVIQPQQNQLTLQYGSPGRDARTNAKDKRNRGPKLMSQTLRMFSFPQQKNVKNTKVLDKPCRVLLPTQYQPQADMMLNQNELMISRRAQRRHQHAHHSKRLHKPELRHASDLRVERLRTVEDAPGEKFIIKGAAESMRIAQRLASKLVEAQAAADIKGFVKATDQLNNKEVGGMMVNAVALTRSTEGRLPELVRKQARSGERSGQNMESLRMSGGRNEVASGDRRAVTLAPCSPDAGDRSGPYSDYNVASSLVSQRSHRHDRDPAVLSSHEDGYTNRPADMTTIFSHKFDITQPAGAIVNDGTIGHATLERRQERSTLSPQSISKSSPQKKEKGPDTSSSRAKRQIRIKKGKKDIGAEAAAHESGQVDLQAAPESPGPKTKERVRKPSTRATRNSALGNYDRQGDAGRDAMLPDLIPVSKVTGVRIQNRLSTAGDRQVPAVESPLQTIMQEAARMKNGQAAPRLVPVHKRSEQPGSENADSRDLDLQGRNMFRNSFFNTYQERMLVQKLMKGGAQQVPLSPRSRDEEPLSRTYESSKVQSKDGSSEELGTDAGCGIPGSGALDVSQPSTVRFVEAARKAGIVTEVESASRHKQQASVDPSDDPEGQVRSSDYSYPLPPQLNHEDQAHTKKHNQYFKKIKNMQKDNQLTVISHPFDLSHLVNAEKRFLTQNLLKAGPQEPRMKSPTRNTQEHQRQQRIDPVQVPQVISPKNAKELWLRRAKERTQQRLKQESSHKNRALLRTMQEKASHQYYSLSSGRVTLHPKGYNKFAGDEAESKDVKDLSQGSPSFAATPMDPTALRETEVADRERPSRTQAEDHSRAGQNKSDAGAHRRFPPHPVKSNQSSPVRTPGKQPTYKHARTKGGSRGIQRQATQQSARRHAGRVRNRSQLEHLQDYISERSKDEEVSTRFRLHDNKLQGTMPDPNSPATAGLGPRASGLGASRASENQPVDQSGEAANNVARHVAYSSFGNQSKPQDLGPSAAAPAEGEKVRHGRAPFGNLNRGRGISKEDSQNRISDNQSPRENERSSRVDVRNSLTFNSEYQSSAIARSKHGTAWRAKEILEVNAGAAADRELSREILSREQASATAGGTKGPEYTMNRNQNLHKVNIEHRRAGGKSLEPTPLRINTVRLEHRDESHPSSRKESVCRRMAREAVDPSIYKLSVEPGEAGPNPQIDRQNPPPKSSSTGQRRPHTKNVFSRGTRDEQILVQNQKQPPTQAQQSAQGTQMLSQPSAEGSSATSRRLDQADLQSSLHVNTLLKGMPLYGQQPLSNRTLVDSRELAGPSHSNQNQEIPLPQQPHPFLTITTHRGTRLKLPPEAKDFRDLLQQEESRQSVNSSQVREALDQIRRTNDEYQLERCHQSTQESFKPVNAKEIRLQYRDEGAAKDYEGKRATASVPSRMRMNSQGSTESKAKSVIKVARITARRPKGTKEAAQKQNTDRVLYGTDKPLDKYTINVLRQKTLYKMQISLWEQYEREWAQFQTSDHVKAQAPIPPNCLLLPLHIYLTMTQMSVDQLKSSVAAQPCLDPFGGQEGARTHRTCNDATTSPEPLPSQRNAQKCALTGSSVDSSDFATSMKQPSAIDSAAFDQCYKAAKRRLLMCSNRIIDEQALTHMKSEVHEGFRQIRGGVKESPKAGTSHSKHMTFLGEDSFIAGDQKSIDPTEQDISVNDQLPPERKSATMMIEDNYEPDRQAWQTRQVHRAPGSSYQVNKNDLDVPEATMARKLYQKISNFNVAEGGRAGALAAEPASMTGVHSLLGAPDGSDKHSQVSAGPL